MDEAGSREPLCRREEAIAKTEDIKRGQSGRRRTNGPRPRPRGRPDVVVAKQRETSKSRTREACLLSGKARWNGLAPRPAPQKSRW